MKISATLLVIFAAGTNANATPDPVDYTPSRAEKRAGGRRRGDGAGLDAERGLLRRRLRPPIERRRAVRGPRPRARAAAGAVLQRRRHRVLFCGLQRLRPELPALPKGRRRSCRGAGPARECIGCAVGCTSYLHCAGASWEHCTNSPPPPSPRPPPPSGGHPSGADWIQHNGMRRNFQMGPTTCTSPPCPLVLVMHGWTMSTANMVSSTSMNSRVSAQGRGGAVVVYPDGTGSGLQKCWRVQNAQPPPFSGCSNPAIDDVGYIAALIDLMISRYNVDANRVYAMGFSNGGTMTLQLACFLNWKITAFGIVAAGPLNGEGGSHRFVDTWQCPHPNRRLSSGRVPMMWVHGCADPLAAYSPMSYQLRSGLRASKA